MGKQNIKVNIEKHREALEKMALDIWAKPEAGFREFNATKLQQDYLKNMGAKITSPVDVVETAFIAEYGSGKPIIGILGEFDALPGLSQKAGLTVQDPLEPGAYGHACTGIRRSDGYHEGGQYPRYPALLCLSGRGKPVR